MASGTQKILRATTRYNNWYNYDVQTSCELVTNKTLLENTRGPFDSNEQNNCKLIGGYSVGILEYAEDLYNFKTELATNIWANDFKSATNYSIDLYAAGYILRDAIEKVPAVPTVQPIFQGEHKLLCGPLHIRLLVFVTSVAFMIISISYSSSLVANLSTVSYNVETLQDLINSNYELLITVGCTNSSGVYFSIKKASQADLLAQQLLARKSEKSFIYDTFEKAIYAVRDVPLAFFTYDDLLDDLVHKYIGELPCSWTKLPVLNIQRHWTMLVREDSSYREEINMALIRARETGEMKYLNKKWMPPKAVWDGRIKLPVVNIRNLHWVYIIFVIGFILSSLILILERRWKDKEKSTEVKR